VWVVGQPDPAVVQERLDQRGPGALPPPRLTLAGQLSPDRLAVYAQMAGDRRDRPALLTQRMRLHVVLPRQHPALQRRSTVTNTANHHLMGY
jgi:hypothetical protein